MCGGCLLCVVRCLVFVVCCVLFEVCWFRVVVWCVYVARRVLCVVCCLSLVGSRSLCVVRCLMFVVCRLLLFIFV